MLSTLLPVGAEQRPGERNVVAGVVDRAAAGIDVRRHVRGDERRGRRGDEQAAVETEVAGAGIELDDIRLQRAAVEVHIATDARGANVDVRAAQTDAAAAADVEAAAHDRAGRRKSILKVGLAGEEHLATGDVGDAVGIGAAGAAAGKEEPIVGVQGAARLVVVAVAVVADFDFPAVQASPAHVVIAVAAGGLAHFQVPTGGRGQGDVAAALVDDAHGAAHRADIHAAVTPPTTAGQGQRRARNYIHGGRAGALPDVDVTHGARARQGNVARRVRCQGEGSAVGGRKRVIANEVARSVEGDRLAAAAATTEVDVRVDGEGVGGIVGPRRRTCGAAQGDFQRRGVCAVSEREGTGAGGHGDGVQPQRGGRRRIQHHARRLTAGDIEVQAGVAGNSAETAASVVERQPAAGIGRVGAVPQGGVARDAGQRAAPVAGRIKNVAGAAAAASPGGSGCKGRRNGGHRGQKRHSDR